MKEKPLVGILIDGIELDHKLLEMLELVSRTCSQRRAAKKIGITPQVFNRRILKFEDKLGFKLIKSGKSGSELTPEGAEILRRYHEYQNLLEKGDKILIAAGYISSQLIGALLESYGLDAALYTCSDYEAFHLSKKCRLDLITLDDPLIAFRNNLDFIPIAYDHLALIPDAKIEGIHELDNAKFVAVENSSQRLAWRILRENGIKFKIVQRVKSPFQAFQIIKETPNLYTFLNASKFPGNNILKEETRHVISIIPFHERVKDFIEFIFSEGQTIIKKEGFERL
ncbi:MAG TPA: LysR family transcriptional regulator [Methanothermobacter sp.]|nr:predicted transcriptional regulator [Methanothermobacter sp. MT-2]HHW04971.1 LysR family transcriptional regulator [Methanothermobacter sp.]HOK72335.1 LysR family transcriptional regulator [Methanothermobacter sp.]HOL68863.1 LysR family transcriptional regulator [Methanothermobacter sp.]HPQ05311.1 LysR family transcriptional regulator [Methanothermobacter sp.]